MCHTGGSEVCYVVEFHEYEVKEWLIFSEVSIKNRSYFMGLLSVYYTYLTYTYGVMYVYVHHVI